MVLGGVKSLPWWPQSFSVENLFADIGRCEAVYDDSERARVYMAEYQKCMAILCVHNSNLIEGTSPKGFEDIEAFTFLHDLFDGELDPDFGNKAWNADGKNKDAAEGQSQLIQHLRALIYLCYTCKPGSTDLTAEMIKETHRLLMGGAVSDSGQPVAAGQFRTNSAECKNKYNQTQHQYLDPDKIAGSTQTCVDAYNAAVQHGMDVFERTAQLHYDIIHTVHPVEDGNGRLGRLLIAYALMAAGVPFPLPLVNGHKKISKKFCYIVSEWSKSPKAPHLQLFIMECLHHAWLNFVCNFESMGSLSSLT